MPSLTQLFTRHRNLLVLDAASSRVQIGLLASSSNSVWHASEAEAGTEIFVGLTTVLDRAGLEIGNVAAILFGEGPGSMLGIRTVAMALRTWSVLSAVPTYAFQSLAVAGEYEWRREPPRDFTVIADARRDSWHCQAVGADGRLEPIQRRTGSSLPAGELLTPENFRSWAKPPRPAGLCSYDLATILPVIVDSDRFHAVERPEAFQSDPPDYRKWTAQVHRVATVDEK